LRGQMSIAMGQLANAMGLPADTQLNVSEMPKELPFDKICKDIDHLIELAKNQRPDLKATYADYRQTWANLQSARSASLPTLVANGLFERVTFIHDPKFNGNFAQGQVTLNMPIFNGFFYYYNIKSARELVDAAWAEFRTQEETVYLDVITSYYNFKTAVGLVQYSQKLLAYAQETYDVAYIGYRHGVNSILDLLAAQVTLANARFTEIQARSQLAISLVSIAYSSGVLYN
jgi:outer membrane protein